MSTSRPAHFGRRASTDRFYRMSAGRAPLLVPRRPPRYLHTPPPRPPAPKAKALGESLGVVYRSWRVRVRWLDYAGERGSPYLLGAVSRLWSSRVRLHGTFGPKSDLAVPGSPVAGRSYLAAARPPEAGRSTPRPRRRSCGPARSACAGVSTIVKPTSSRATRGPPRHPGGCYRHVHGRITRRQ